MANQLIGLTRRCVRMYALIGAGLCCGTALSAAADAELHQSNVPNESAAAGNTDVLVEITVTARKRSEKLIDTPVSVQVVGSDLLAQTQVTDLISLSTLVPQLNISQFPSGSGLLAIRGIGSSPTDNAIASTVSTVFDGVQSSRGLLTTLGFFDVQNVEVLKGPQALFFGKNSPAGVVSVSSNAPAEHWEGYAHEGYEFNAREPSIEAAFGGPVSDTLKIRFAAKYDTMEGYLTNNAQSTSIPNPLSPLLGLPSSPYALDGASSGHTPDDTSVLGRLTVEWTPFEHFTAAAHMMGGHVRSNGDGNSLVDKCFNASQAHPYELGVPDPTGSCTVGTSVSNYVNPADFLRPLPFSSEREPFTDFTGTLDSVQLSYDAGLVALTSVTGYIYYDSTFLETLDGQFSVFGSGLQQTFQQESEELRAVSQFDFPVNVVGGVFLEKEALENHDLLFLGSGFLPPDPTTGQTNSTNSVTNIKGDTISPFAQAIWKFNSQWEFDAGARWTRETKRAYYVNNGDNPYTVIPGLLPDGEVLTGSQVFYNTSPEATFTWHPSRETMMYVAYKSGYKSGGYSGASTLTGNPLTTTANNTYGFKPEKSSGGEIGLKGRFLEDTLQVTAAIYDYRFRDLQESIFSAATDSFNVQNAAVATTKGVETEIELRVSPELTVNADLSYDRARFQSYANAACYQGQTTPTCLTAQPYQVLSGTRLPYSSDWIEQVGFNWDHALPGGGYAFSLGGHVQYLSSFNSSPTDNPTANFGPEYLMDANVGFYPSSKRWKVQLVGRNLLDRHYLVSVTDKPGATNALGQTVPDVFGVENRPREIWLKLSETF